MLSTVSPVMVGAEAVSTRTITLSACRISTPAMNTGFFIGKLTAIGSTRSIFTDAVSLSLYILLVCMFFELDQGAEKVARMDEGDPLAGDVVLRFAVAEHADPVAGEAALHSFPTRRSVRN